LDIRRRSLVIRIGASEPCNAFFNLRHGLLRKENGSPNPGGRGVRLVR
jgi:hypothetical protein